MINDIKTEYEEERAAKESQRRFSDAFWQKNCGLSPNLVSASPGWQLCPVCDGAGHFANLATTNAFDKCPVCKGKMIISRLTGLPPVYETQGKL